MEDQEDQNQPWYKADWLKVSLIGGAGYLLGSIFPAGYLNYLVRSTFFAETLASTEPVFDRSRLNDAEKVELDELTSTLDANPSFFESKFLDKPVIITGKIEYFLDGSFGSSGQTATIDTGVRYGPSIIVTFADEASEGVLALRKGETMTAKCLVTGTLSDSIHMQHCEVL